MVVHQHVGILKIVTLGAQVKVVDLDMFLGLFPQGLLLHHLEGKLMCVLMIDRIRYYT